MAIELRERSPREASPFRSKTRHLACSASVGACDRHTLGAHTPPVARTFLWVQLVHFHACTHVWLKAHEKGLLHAHVVSLHLAFSTLMFHPSSPLSSDNLFDTAFQSLTFTDLLPGLSRPKTTGPAHFRNGEEDFGYMANMLHSTLGPCPMSVLSSLTIAAVSVLARRPADEATFLSTQSHSTLSLQLGGSAAGLSEFCGSDSQILELGESRGSPVLSCFGLHFLSSATQENFRSSATPADFRSSPTFVDCQS